VDIVGILPGKTMFLLHHQLERRRSLEMDAVSDMRASHGIANNLDLAHGKLDQSHEVVQVLLSMDTSFSVDLVANDHRGRSDCLHRKT
jgi:hypothetical protein